ncbi:MAG: hypothetical protein F4X15_15115 [Gemmatimonadetes bacterium]|nr:hypothetical protein [Gemmatimonadota bacterium]
MASVATAKAGRTGDAGVLEGLAEADFCVDRDERIEVDSGDPPPQVIWILRTHDDIERRPTQEAHEAGGWRIDRLLAEVSTRPRAADSGLGVYSSRIAYLRDEATHDGYGLNEDSERDFKQFVRSRPSIRKGDLVLLDNGNLRAVWKDEQGGRLGVQFLGSDVVQYVIFSRRQRNRPVSRVAGRDSLEGVARQIDVFDLHSLLAE